MNEQEICSAYKVQPLKHDMRSQILATAQHIAYRRGFSAVRMDEVAYELGISKKTLYTYFRSKEEMLEEMLLAKYKHHTSQFKALLNDKSLSYIARLEQLMRIAWQASREFSKEMLQNMRRKEPHLWSIYTQLHETVICDALQQMLTQGQQQGWLREEIRMNIFLDMFLDSASHGLKTSDLRQYSYSVRDMQDTFFFLMFNSILSEKPVASATK